MSAWTYRDADSYLLDREIAGIDLGVKRMRRLLTELGDPQRVFTAIHVVGSNGKTSTTAITAAILQAHGVQTGCYTSPHLISFTERIRVAGHDISPKTFARSVETVAEASSVIEGEGQFGIVTQFETLTAAAFVAFSASKVQVAVIETGLGGRLDATNVVDAPIVGLTSASLEHSDWLGPDLVSIANEKLAVVPRGGTLVVGRLPAEVSRVARQRVSEQGGTLIDASESPMPEGLEGFEAKNARMSRALAQRWCDELDEDKVAKALSEKVLGRLTRVAESPQTTLDGAHNPEAINELLSLWTPHAPGKKVALVSVLDDKHRADMFCRLVEACDAIVVTRSSHPRAVSADRLASEISQLSDIPVSVCTEVASSLEFARSVAGPDGSVVATGSLYLVGDLLQDLTETDE